METTHEARGNQHRKRNQTMMKTPKPRKNLVKPQEKLDLDMVPGPEQCFAMAVHYLDFELPIGQMASRRK